MVFSPRWHDASIEASDDFMTGGQRLLIYFRVGYTFELGKDQGAFPKDVMKEEILNDVSTMIDQMYKEFK